MIQELDDQKSAALEYATRIHPYVAMLHVGKTDSSDWTWKIVDSFSTREAAEFWFDSQVGLARVWFFDKNNQVYLNFAK